MERVTSKRHFYNFYVGLAGLFTLFFSLSLVIFIMFLQEIKKGNVENKIYFLPLFGVALLIVAFYLIIQYHKNTPRIIITEKSIQVNRKLYKLSYIKEVKYTGRQKFKNMMPTYKEGAKINFTNGDVVYIYDNLYENASELKLYLEAVLNPEKAVSSLPTSAKINIKGEHFYNYNKPLLFSVTGILFTALGGMMLVMFIGLIQQSFTAFYGLFMFLVIYYFLSVRVHYFSLNENYLVIRNNVLFGKKTIYVMANIKEAVLVPEENRMPNALRIITHDYKSTLYYAATLYDSDWREFAIHLEKEGIQVRNELNF